MKLEKSIELRNTAVSITHSQYMTLYSLVALGPLPPSEDFEDLREKGLVTLEKSKDPARAKITSEGKLVYKEYHNFVKNDVKTVFEYEVEPVGIERTDWFRGASSGSNWNACRVGIGNTFVEAFQDAVDMLAQDSWAVETLPDAVDLTDGIEHHQLNTSVSDYMVEHSVETPANLEWYVILRVK